MKLPGIVTNVAAFGAFVDIGVHQDGLVHVSEVSDTFVQAPFHLQQLVFFSLHHFGHRNSGGTAHHLGNFFGAHLRAQ